MRETRDLNNDTKSEGEERSSPRQGSTRAVRCRVACTVCRGSWRHEVDVGEMLRPQRVPESSRLPQAQGQHGQAPEMRQLPDS